WKHKTGDLALVQQESMARRIGIEIGTHNGSQIIERRRGRKVVGRRWEIQWLECAFAGLGECSSGCGGDETDRHQQRDGFSVAFKRRAAFHTTMVLRGCSWGPLPK